MNQMEKQDQKKEDRKNRLNKPLNNFAKYSGIAFQMIAIILFTTWGGTRLDKLTGFHTPVFTIILSLFGVFAAIYVVIKDFLK